MSKHFQKYKETLQSNDVDAFIAELSLVNTASELQSIRHQKLLFAPTDLLAQSKVADVYGLAATRILAGADLEKALNYVSFTKVVVNSLQRYRDLTKILLKPLSGLSLADLLSIVEDSTLEMELALSKGLGESLDRNTRQSVPESVEVSEYFLHEYNGLRNEAWWALSRTINEVSSVIEPTANTRVSRKIRAKAKEVIARLQQIGLMWNNLTYLVDKVSYEEWFVSKCSFATKPDFVFDVSDVLAERAKVLGIRRSITENIRRQELGKRGSTIVEAISLNIAMKAATWVSKRLRFGPISENIRNSLEELTRSFARMFDYEDQALFEAAKDDDEIRQEYFAAITLYSAMGGLAVTSSSLTLGEGRRIRQHGLPLSFFREVAAAFDWPQRFFESALRAQTSTLPVRNYFDLVRRPFLLSEGKIRLIGYNMVNDWTGAVRSRLIKGGAIGLRYGELWERQCASLFASYGWIIVGQGVKLKDEKRIVTDVDLIVAKDSLLLLVQCKAMGISSDTVYEHWLARSKILKGVEQAIAASKHLKEYPDCLRDLTKKSGHQIESLKLQPVVITSSPIFTGWNPQGIPILSLGNVVSILKGATVTYMSSEGQVLSKTSHISGESPNSEDFLALLTKPIDWRVAAHGNAISHRVVESNEMRTSLPELCPPAEGRATAKTARIVYQG